jgi:sugar phosphate isomerase/epimerase
MTMNRRAFMKGAALAAGTAVVCPAALAADTAAGENFRTTLLKSHIKPKISDPLCEQLLAAGLTGVELSDKKISIEEARQGRLTAEKHGLKIHSFMAGWGSLGESDPAKRAAAVEEAKGWIRLSAAYGATTMLLVPHRIGGTMPKPAEFEIDFDPATLTVKSVVQGDNAPFAKYIADHNSATMHSIQSINELIPVAAHEGVVIALENVWNNLWVKPELALAYLRAFDSVWVKQYLDLGNHTRYDRAEKWLELFGREIVKLHIKDFLIERGAKNDGQFVPIGKGSVDWKSVRAAIDKAGYSGWVSIESGGWSDAEHSRILDNIFAGKGAAIG